MREVNTWPLLNARVSLNLFIWKIKVALRFTSAFISALSCVRRNRHPICFESHYESEASCIVYILKISLHSYANKTNFHDHMKCFVLSLGNGQLFHLYPHRLFPHFKFISYLWTLVAP